jgi:hypothetical protein
MVNAGSPNKVNFRLLITSPENVYEVFARFTASPSDG